MAATLFAEEVSCSSRKAARTSLETSAPFQEPPSPWYCLTARRTWIVITDNRPKKWKIRFHPMQTAPLAGSSALQTLFLLVAEDFLRKFLFHGAVCMSPQDVIAGTQGPVSVGLRVLCVVTDQCCWACYTVEATDSWINGTRYMVLHTQECLSRKSNTSVTFSLLLSDIPCNFITHSSQSDIQLTAKNGTKWNVQIAPGQTLGKTQETETRGVLVGKQNGKRPPAWTRRKQDCIKMNLQETGWGSWSGFIWLGKETGGEFLWMQ